MPHVIYTAQDYKQRQHFDYLNLIMQHLHDIKPIVQHLYDKEIKC